MTSTLAIVCGCTRSENPNAAPPSTTQEPAKVGTPADAPKCRDGIDALAELKGKTEAQVVELYGQPRGRRAFAMADCCHEFEIALYNTYPPGKGHDAVEIHELTWHDGTNRLTIWAHEVDSDWVVLDTLCYHEGDEF